MATIYYEKDADLSLLNGKKIAIIGYGSQGHAHALNLKESGCDVRVGLYAGSKSWGEAEKAGLTVKPVADAAAEADIIMMLVPDTKAAEVYRDSIAPNLTKGKMLMFAHGFGIHYGQIVPPDDVEVRADGGRQREANWFASHANPYGTRTAPRRVGGCV